MSNIVIAGDTSGSVTLQAPAVAGGTVVTLPATTGTAALTSDLLGVGQTWQDATLLPGGRALGTTYTNNTGKPIQVMITGLGTPGGGALSFSINSIVIGRAGTAAVSSGSSYPSFNVIVPNGATYTCSVASTCVLNQWWELR